MRFLIALILATLFVIFAKDSLKKHPNVFYAIAGVISLIGIIGQVCGLFSSLPSWVNSYVVQLFTQGALSTALWCAVMWANAFPNGSKPIKQLMPIRGELSIFACILTLGHNIGYGISYKYFQRLFTGQLSGTSMWACIITIVLMLIMIPLTVMSIPHVRKKMKAKTWKNIQRVAYVFYGLIYVHVLVLTLNSSRLGRSGYWFSILLYSLVFIGYAIFRIRKFILLKKKPKSKLMLNIVSAVIGVLLFGAVAVYAYPVKQASTDEETTTITLEDNEEEEVYTLAPDDEDEAVDEEAAVADEDGVEQEDGEDDGEEIEDSDADADEEEENDSDEEEDDSDAEAEEDADADVEDDEDDGEDAEVEAEDDAADADAEVETDAEGNVEVTATTKKDETTTAGGTTKKGETATTTKKSNTTTAKNTTTGKTTAKDTDTTSVTTKATTGATTKATTKATTTTTKATTKATTTTTTTAKTYKDGTYTASAYGYDGNVTITIVISNDKITSITGSTDESDDWYFDTAKSSIFNAILNTQSTSVDTVSGATYSSNAIISAVNTCLKNAKN